MSALLRRREAQRTSALTRIAISRQTRLRERTEVSRRLWGTPESALQRDPRQPTPYDFPLRNGYSLK